MCHVGSSRVELGFKVELSFKTIFIHCTGSLLLSCLGQITAPYVRRHEYLLHQLLFWATWPCAGTRHANLSNFIFYCGTSHFFSSPTQSPTSGIFLWHSTSNPSLLRSRGTTQPSVFNALTYVTYDPCSCMGMGTVHCSTVSDRALLS